MVKPRLLKHMYSTLFHCFAAWQWAAPSELVCIVNVSPSKMSACSVERLQLLCTAGFLPYCCPLTVLSKLWSELPSVYVNSGGPRTWNLDHVTWHDMVQNTSGLQMLHNSVKFYIALKRPHINNYSMSQHWTWQKKVARTYSVNANNYNSS